VTIDPRNGVIVKEQILEEHRESFDKILDRMIVREVDVESAPWPSDAHGGTSSTRVGIGTIKYRPPEPGTGLVVSDGSDGGPLHLFNGRSQIQVTSDMWRHDDLVGAVDWEKVDDRDRDAFERFLGEVEVRSTGLSR
jgi:hypothetical protein